MGADDFNLSGTKDEALFGFGDAVCVPVVSWIAEHYLDPALNQIIDNEKRASLIAGNYAATA
jgi:DNA (cytosine-5)-methyltransferase 1